MYEVVIKEDLFAFVVLCIHVTIDEIISTYRLNTIRSQGEAGNPSILTRSPANLPFQAFNAVECAVIKVVPRPSTIEREVRARGLIDWG
jgi:hypothetical protein